MAALSRISRLPTLRSSSSCLPSSISTTARNKSTISCPSVLTTSSYYYVHHPSTIGSSTTTTTTSLLQLCEQQHQQVRYHNTNYEGPGKFDERETGSNFNAAPHHDHSHNHHEHQQESISDDEKQHIRQLLKARYTRRSGSYAHRGYTIGIGGPVGSGKTALTLALCRALRTTTPMGVVTNDIFTQEDAEFLSRNDALSHKDHIIPVETGGCPHAAIREDVSANLGALELLTRRIFRDEEKGGGDDDDDDIEIMQQQQQQQQKKLSVSEPLLLCESGGDNLAANFSSELADYTVYVIDVAGGDKIPRKGGPGITQSDLLVINKIDLADAVGASLDVMKRDANKMRGIEEKGGGPTIFASVKNGVGVNDIVKHILNGYENAHRLVECAR